MHPRFASREDAARQLAAGLAAYRGRNPLVFAIPRGAVGMGAVIAEALGGELEVVLVHKLGARLNPELAIGAVDETGWMHLEPHAYETGADAAYIEREKRAQLARLRARRALYTGARNLPDAEGRVAIIVDDGLATGASMIAALHAVRAKRPARLVCAVPVAVPDGLERVSRLADEVVCLSTPFDFRAVSQYYRAFPQVEDEEVIAILRRTARRSGREHPP